MDFKSVLNQIAARRILTRTADRDQLPNSYLFCGPQGVGKWATALALTAYLNCSNKQAGDSCGVCPACRQLRKLQFPNLVIAVPTPPSKSESEETQNYWNILNGKINEPYSLIGGRRQMSIPVATVRLMRRSLSQKPPQSGTRVVIIEQMDRMLMTSADALLKIIEEPPGKTLIIITTARPEKLLPTVISRCRKVRFTYLPTNEVAAYLQKRSDLSQARAVLLARLGRGSLGRALYLSGDDHEQDREVAKLIFKGMFLSPAVNLIAEAAEILPFRDRFRVNRIIEIWQTLFRDLILLKNGEQTSLLINIDFAAELEKIAALDLPHEQLIRFPSTLGSVIEDIDLNVDTRAAIGGMLIGIRNSLGLDNLNIDSHRP
jgi:DNA polymerase-3 subunit delta'